MELEDLKELNQLKGRLRISGIAWTNDVNQAKTAQLDGKKDLVVLQLEFQGGGGDKDPSLLENLQPHSNLKRLEISHYRGATMFPSWITSLHNLKRLVLQECSQCKSLGPFGKLPSLEFLSIQSMKSVTKVDQQFLGIENGSTGSFSKLKTLELIHLGNCKEWESSPSSNSFRTIMPCLVSLEIRDCPALEAPLPQFLRGTPLEILTIKDCPILEQRFQEQQGLGTESLLRVLTSTTEELNNAETDGGTDMEAEACKDDPQTSRRGEISQADDDGKADKGNNI